MKGDYQLGLFDDRVLKPNPHIDKIIGDIKSICPVLEPKQVYRGCARYECLKCKALYAYRCRCCGEWARRKK